MSYDITTSDWSPQLCGWKCCDVTISSSLSASSRATAGQRFTDRKDESFWQIKCLRLDVLLYRTTRQIVNHAIADYHYDWHNPPHTNATRLLRDLMRLSSVGRGYVQCPTTPFWLISIWSRNRFSKLQFMLIRYAIQCRLNENRPVVATYRIDIAMESRWCEEGFGCAMKSVVITNIDHEEDNIVIMMEGLAALDQCVCMVLTNWSLSPTPSSPSSS